MEYLLPDTQSEKKKENVQKRTPETSPFPVFSHLKSTACFEVSSLLDILKDTAVRMLKARFYCYCMYFIVGVLVY